MTADSESATSFGNVAGTYDRVRPGPAPAAMDWLVPAGCEVAVDLAAGTGLFTRALLGRVGRVVAVEPDPRMLEVLAKRSPEVDARPGRGEAMPLDDASADAVFVSTAWHWFDPARAVPEIARVLRPGGRLGVLWTSRDRDQDWVAELDLLRLPATSDAAAHPENQAAPAGPGEPGGPEEPDEPRTVAEVRADLVRHHIVTLPPGSEFDQVQTASFGFSRTVSVPDALAWLATNSAFITASAADREAGLARCEAALLGQVSGRAPDGEPLVEMPMRSWCWRARRSLPLYGPVTQRKP